MTTTRRPTAKQRELMIDMLGRDDMSRITVGVQTRTLFAMWDDQWIDLFTPMGERFDRVTTGDAQIALAHTMSLTADGARAIGKLVEYDAKRAEINGRRMVGQAADRLGVAIDDLQEDLITGWRQVGNVQLEQIEAVDAELTHSCDRCRRRFAGPFPTWNDLCGFCHWHTDNGAPPHMGGLIPGATMHAKQPNTAAARCSYGTRVDLPENTCMTDDAGRVDCRVCKVLQQHADGMLTDAERDTELVLLGVLEPPAVDELLTREEIRDSEDTGLTAGAVLEVDPAPGSIDDIVTMIRLYGDARAAAIAESDKADRSTALQHAADHLDYIVEQLNKHYADPTTPTELDMPAAAGAVFNPHGAAKRTTTLLDRLISAAALHGPADTRTRRRRDDLVDHIGAMLAAMAPPRPEPVQSAAAAPSEPAPAPVPARRRTDPTHARAARDAATVTVELPDFPIDHAAGVAVLVDGLDRQHAETVDADPATLERLAAERGSGALGGETVWCELPQHGTMPHFDSPECVNPHFTDPATRARINEEAAAAPLEAFVFTFGPAHLHPATGDELGDCYVMIEGDDRAAADRIMFDRFGDQFAFGYDPEQGRRVLAEFPEMREIPLPDALPAIPLRRVVIGDGDFVYKGLNGAALFHAVPGRDDLDRPNGTYMLSNELPGMTGEDRPCPDLDAVEQCARHLLQQWQWHTFGLRIRVEIS